MVEPAAAASQLGRADAVRAAGLFPARPRFHRPASRSSSARSACATRFARTLAKVAQRRSATAGYAGGRARMSRAQERRASVARRGLAWSPGRRTRDRAAAERGALDCAAASRTLGRVGSAGAAASSPRSATPRAGACASAPASTGSPSPSRVGCLVYFALPREPMVSALAAVAVVAAAVAALGLSARRRRGGSRRSLAICLAGATAAKLRVDGLDGAACRARAIRRSSPAASSPRRAAPSAGRASCSTDVATADLAASETMPERIRVTLARKHGLPPLGARIALRARLMPVAGPVVPGGYDPRRAAFFEGIGASGFALGGWHAGRAAAALRRRPRRRPHPRRHRCAHHGGGAGRGGRGRGGAARRRAERAVGRDQREPPHLRACAHPLDLRPAHDADRRRRRSSWCAPCWRCRRGWR